MDHFLGVVVFLLIVSFLSNVSPFFGASYTLWATLELTLLGFTPYNFIVIVLITGLGATAAKIVIYFGAFELGGFLRKNKNVRLIGKNSSSWEFYFILFVGALLPIFPLDDFVYIGAGATSASLGLMSVVTLAAKILKSEVEVAIEFAILQDLNLIFGFQRLDITIVLTAIFVVIGIAIFRLDWEKTYRRFFPAKQAEEAGLGKSL